MLAAISRRVSHHNVTIVPDVRRKLSLDSVGAFFGLPSACMSSLGILKRFVSCNVIDVEARHRNFHINAERVCTHLIASHVALLLIPSDLDILAPATDLPVLGDKEVLSQLNTSESCRLEGMQLPGEFLPVQCL